MPPEAAPNAFTAPGLVDRPAAAVEDHSTTPTTPSPPRRVFTSGRPTPGLFPPRCPRWNPGRPSKLPSSYQPAHRHFQTIPDVDISSSNKPLPQPTVRQRDHLVNTMLMARRRRWQCNDRSQPAARCGVGVAHQRCLTLCSSSQAAESSALASYSMATACISFVEPRRRLSHPWASRCQMLAESRPNSGEAPRPPIALKRSFSADLQEPFAAAKYLYITGTVVCPPIRLLSSVPGCQSSAQKRPPRHRLGGTTRSW